MKKIKAFLFVSDVGEIEVWFHKMPISPCDNLYPCTISYSLHNKRKKTTKSKGRTK